MLISPPLKEHSFSDSLPERPFFSRRVELLSWENLKNIFISRNMTQLAEGLKLLSSLTCKIVIEKKKKKITYKNE